MKRCETLAAASALVWAGLVAGGSLIAAPAKFNAPSLNLKTALEVGREQFIWVGIGEAVVCVVVLAALIAGRTRLWRLMIIPIVIFFIQRIWLMPLLDVRTVAIIGGQAVGPSNLHLVFIVMEVAKVLLLLVVAAWSLSHMQHKNQP